VNLFLPDENFFNERFLWVTTFVHLKSTTWKKQTNKHILHLSSKFWIFKDGAIFNILSLILRQPATIPINCQSSPAKRHPIVTIEVNWNHLSAIWTGILRDLPRTMYAFWNLFLFLPSRARKNLRQISNCCMIRTVNKA